MADIAPFRGLHYACDRIGNLSEVLAPPYDVLSPSDRDALYDRNSFNVVRIILNRPESGDPPNASYARAAGYLQGWHAGGILTEDPVPAFYLYRQGFHDPTTDARRCRTGFFCALRLVPYEEGIVLPHEYTKPAAKADRLALLRSTHTNTEPIFALYEDPGLEIASLLAEAVRESAPLLTAETDGITHEVYAITGQDVLRDVRRRLADRRVWIADGHHRYETALSFFGEVRARNHDLAEGASRILVVLAPFEDPGIAILPTHRLIRLGNSSARDHLHMLLRQRFAVEKLDGTALALEVASSLNSSDGKLVMLTASGASVLTLREPRLMEAAAPGAGSDWRRLDVSILQTVLLEPLLDDSSPRPDVTYTHDASEAVATLEEGLCDVAFLVGRPSPEDLRRVTAQGDRMPAKSTFFYPKLWSGLLMRRLGP